MNTPLEFIKTYEQALGTQSWTEIEPLIHERCVATFSEGTYVGRDQVEAAFRKTFELIQDETYSIRDITGWRKRTIQPFLRMNFSGPG